ncbi:PrpF, AcnD-accessory [Rhodococcus ruber]|uniref:PrpF, AcnD-accessory n=1 Tax=Rhodococcus ruber TaxID=1830 RepID=A0ABT4MLG8_9NOCA|nr:PrpF domain-containing protein [Rhodococcus ruber]MCZ4521816.1 PrpF, AcnD-accessory [Rhodococcus ruber]
MYSLRGTWMRGGTSKCWLFSSVDVEPLIEQAGSLDEILVSAFGSGDPRQLDGVGGGSSTTSKAAIVSRSSEDGIDVDYLFAQVAIGDRKVEWGSNCGNCATAIGLYALQQGLVAIDPVTTIVRLRNRNTGAVLLTEIDTPGGVVPSEGSAQVAGTSALGVPVGLTFIDLGADRTRLLPTGSVEDTVELHGSQYRGTMVVAGAPAALFDASDLGMTGAESAAELAERVPLLVELRRSAALLMGLSRPQDPITHAVPKVGIIAPPVDYHLEDGTLVTAGEYDVCVRMLSMMAPHPSIGLTSAVAVAAAATVRGGVVDRVVDGAATSTLRLGTPAGVLDVDVDIAADGNLTSVTLHRAARRIATAELFVSAAATALSIG